MSPARRHMDNALHQRSHIAQHASTRRCQQASIHSRMMMTLASARRCHTLNRASIEMRTSRALLAVMLH
eukprot:scaffold138546_cov23-Prasinocladus_malaysianus.AAC.1